MTLSRSRLLARPLGGELAGRGVKCRIAKPRGRAVAVTAGASRKTSAMDCDTSTSAGSPTQGIPPSPLVSNAPIESQPPSSVMDEEFAPVPALAEGAAVLLGQAAARSAGGGRPTCFHLASLPNTTLRDYAARVERLFQCSSSCFAMSLIYIDRLAQRHPSLVVEPLNSFKLLLTSAVVAVKVNDDIFFSNRYYANVGGVTLQELNAMEVEFLKLLGFSLRVGPQEFAVYRDLCQAAAEAPPTGP